MHTRYDERKGDLRNASFLEVIVAVIIVLVIMLHSNSVDFAEQKDVLVNKIKSLSEENERLSLLVNDLKKLKRALEDENEELKRKNELYRKYVDASNFREAMVEENLTLKDKVAVLESQLAAAKKKLKDVGSGIDKPFCRLPVLDYTRRQTHKWLGRVSWSEQGIDFRIDPSLDPIEARNIPGVELLQSGSPLSSREFKAAARLAFDHSKEQNIECRYNVIIEVDPLIDPPSSFIILVETYFYKGVRRIEKN